jgi:hypothetical protein
MFRIPAIAELHHNKAMKKIRASIISSAVAITVSAILIVSDLVDEAGDIGDTLSYWSSLLFGIFLMILSYRNKRKNEVTHTTTERNKSVKDAAR